MSTEAALHWFLAWGRAARFAFAVVAAVLSPKLYTPRARMATTRQIYFTAWQVLPGFTLFATLLGLVVVEITLRAAWQFGLEQYALELIFRALVLELMPLLTALFVALRSGAAISSEIALMRIAGEFEDLPSAGIEPFEREFVPRVAAAATSVREVCATPRSRKTCSAASSSCSRVTAACIFVLRAMNLVGGSLTNDH